MGKTVTVSFKTKCFYCKATCTRAYRDLLGELVLKIPHIYVCASCHEEFLVEEGPWNDLH